MSLVHHEPDIATTPCLGCDELIAPSELQKHGHHMWRSCCLWHPYHYWCIRPATRALAPMDRCGECGGVLDDEEINDAMQWAATFPSRVHKGFRYGEGGNDRPESIRLVGWWRRPQVDTQTFPEREIPRGTAMIWRFFEIAHAECHEPDDWRRQLRAAPYDDDLRDVYADHLESIGDTLRSEFVRTVLRRRKATGERAAFLDRSLRELRVELVGSWCRDVARAS